MIPFEMPSVKLHLLFLFPPSFFSCDKVEIRFLLNIPEEELQSVDRLFFQIEQAHWFYEDFFADNIKVKHPTFTTAMTELGLFLKFRIHRSIHTHIICIHTSTFYCCDRTKHFSEILVFIGLYMLKHAGKVIKMKRCVKLKPRWLSFLRI